MPFFLPSDNLYQQRRAGHHTNHSEQNITPCLIFSSDQTQITNFLQKNKTMNHSQEHPELTLLKITPYPHEKHQNCMSNSLHV